MNLLDWQTLAALGMTALAAGYVAREVWLSIRPAKAPPKPGCGAGCGSCAKGSAAKPLAVLGAWEPGKDDFEEEVARTGRRTELAAELDRRAATGPRTPLAELRRQLREEG